MERKNPAKAGLDTEAHITSLGRTLAPHPDSGAIFQPRLSPRRRAALEAVVNYSMTYSEPWRIRELSLSGVFIERTGGRNLPLGAQVEFVLRYRYKGEPVELRMPARVVRLAKDGAALAFGRYDDETYTRLVNLLYT